MNQEWEGAEFWYGNLGVLDTIQIPNMQPGISFKASTDVNPIEQFMYIFFKTTSDAGRNGYVMVDAPVGFDFRLECQVPRSSQVHRFAGFDQIDVFLIYIFKVKLDVF